MANELLRADDGAFAPASGSLRAGIGFPARRHRVPCASALGSLRAGGESPRAGSESMRGATRGLRRPYASRGTAVR
jgi:hypothetical protein